MIAPHGGRLVDSVLRGRVKDRALQDAADLFEISVDERLSREIENIANGVFSPLEGFMVEEDLEGVVGSKRLCSGLPWTIPIVLDVDEAVADRVSVKDTVRISVGGRFVATMLIEDKYRFDRKRLAQSIYGTVDPSHPGVAHTFGLKDVFLGGR